VSCDIGGPAEAGQEGRNVKAFKSCTKYKLWIFASQMANRNDAKKTDMYALERRKVVKI
jgi:hypothetical protein